MNKEQFFAYAQKAWEVFEAKNAEYGNSYREGGLVALLHRFREKSARLRNNVVNEPLRTYIKPDYFWDKLEDDIKDLIVLLILTWELYDEARDGLTERKER